MDSKLIKVYLTLSILIFFSPCRLLAGYAPFFSDSYEDYNYVKKNYKKYISSKSISKNPRQIRKYYELKEKVEKAALRLEPSEIESKKWRQRIISIRRNAMKRRNSEKCSLVDFWNMYSGKFKEYGIFCRGLSEAFPPWAEIEILDDVKKAGGKFLAVRYNVEKGELFYWQKIRLKKNISFYNAFLLVMAGDIPKVVFEVYLNDICLGNLEIEGIRKEWNNFYVFFDDLKEMRFDCESELEIRIVFTGNIVDRKFRKGVFKIRDIAFVRKNPEYGAIKKVSALTYMEGGR